MAMTETVQGTYRVDLSSLQTLGRVRGGWRKQSLPVPHCTRKRLQGLCSSSFPLAASSRVSIHAQPFHALQACRCSTAATKLWET